MWKGELSYDQSIKTNGENYNIVFVIEITLTDVLEARKLSARKAKCNAQPSKGVWIDDQRYYGRGIECESENRRLGYKSI